MALLPDQLYDLTIGEILRYYRMYQISESRMWEKFRFVAWYNGLPYMKKGSNIEPDSLLKLPTDPTDEEKKELQKERQESLKEEAKAVFEFWRSKGYNV